MRKIYLCMILLLSGLAVLNGGCGLSAEKDGKPPVIRAQMEADPMKQEGEKMLAQIELTFEDKTAVAELYDTPASRDLLAQLPMTLHFKDFNGTEKIADPPRSLLLEGAPKGHKPVVGDLTVFAPWGNLAFFYHDSQYSEELVSLGHFISGIDTMAAMQGEFEVQITAVDEKN